MRFTNEGYRPVASNHIYAIKYDPDTLIMNVIFHNGAEYEYYRVELGTYESIMRSPSHGAEFWAHVRQKYSYELLGTRTLDDINKPIPKPSPTSTPLHSIIPELSKLDALDAQEEELNRKFKKRIITEQQRDSALSVIKAKRDRLTKKLEKDGYFASEVKEEQEAQQSIEDEMQEREIESLNNAIEYARKIQRYTAIKRVVITSGFIVAAVLAYHNTGMALLVSLAGICYYKRKRV